MLHVNLGPIMTAEEAKKKYCPYSRSKPNEYAQKCDAEKCMAWMWLENFRKGMLPESQYYALFTEYEEGVKQGRRLGLCIK